MSVTVVQLGCRTEPADDDGAGAVDGVRSGCIFDAAPSFFADAATYQGFRHPERSATGSFCFVLNGPRQMCIVEVAIRFYQFDRVFDLLIDVTFAFEASPDFRFR